MMQSCILTAHSLQLICIAIRQSREVDT